MLRFTIRDLLQLTVIAALAIGWILDHRAMRRARDAIVANCDEQQWKLGALVQLIEDREGQVTLGDKAVSLYIVGKHWSEGPGWTSLERK
jgi:hypothetical protein